MTLPCRFNPATGGLLNFSGQPVNDCADCGGCNTKSFVQVSAVIGHKLNFRVSNLGAEFELLWDCPGCGGVTREDCTPIGALDLSEEVLKDPLCAACRRRKC